MPTFDAVTPGTGGTGAATISHTTGSGSNRYIFIHAHADRVGSAVMSSVTYNGVSATLLKPGTSTADAYRHEVWGLVAPASGANNMVATPSGSDSLWRYHIITFSDVDQTTSTGTAVQAAGGSTTAAVTASSATGDLVVDFLAGDSATVSWTCDASQTSIAGTAPMTGDSYKAGAASVTMQWTKGSSGFWDIIAIPLKAVSGGGIPLPVFMNIQRQFRS